MKKFLTETFGIILILPLIVPFYLLATLYAIIFHRKDLTTLLHDKYGC